MGTKKNYSLLVASLLIINCSLAQTNGDYRSVADGNWSTLTTWQRYNNPGVGWATPTAGQGYPGFSSIPTLVTIQADGDITLDVTPPNNLNNLTLTGGGAFSFNGGTLTTSGNPSLTLNGNLELDDYWSDITFGGSGTFVVAGNVTLDDVTFYTQNGSGNFVTSGNLSVGGLIASFTFSSSGNLTVNGTTSVAALGILTDDNNTGVSIFAGAVTNAGFWTSTGVTSTSNLVFRGGISNTGTFAAGGATFNTNNQALSGTIAFANTVTVTGITVTNNGTVTMSSTGAGALTGTGTWTQGTGTLNYAGSTLTVNTLDASNTGNTVNYNSSVAQTLPSTSTYYNVAINNSFTTSPQITLNNAVTASGTLTMSDGNINLNGNTFTVGTSAASTGTLSHAGASTNGWMYGGNLIRYMATAATTIGGADQNEGFFPLGSASDWRPFYIGKSNTGSSGGRITVSHTNSTSTSDVSIADTNPVATISKRHNSFWTVATSGISAGTWALRAGGTNFGTIASASHLRMSTSAGVVGTNSAGSGGPTDWRVNRTGLTFGLLSNNFHVASTDATNSPLPIELLSFNATLKNSEVELKWSTASETNNDYFTIERARDIEHFEPIITHDGQGTSKELSHYKVMDPSPLYGRSYYRLKQTDFDGKFTYSELKTIDYDGPEFATLTAFPNPLTDPTLNIKIEGLDEAGDLPLQILNLQGQTVFEKVINIETPGIITEEISRDNFPSSGLYIIKAGKTLYMTQKIVIE